MPDTHSEQNDELKPVSPDTGYLASDKKPLLVRQTGWQPDCVQYYSDNGSQNSSINGPIYREEFVRVLANNGGKISFKPRLDGSDDHKWIMGHWHHEKANGVEKHPRDWTPFNKWLRHLCILARNHNASLYRLRRIRFNSDKVVVDNKCTQMSPLPTDKYELIDDPVKAVGNFKKNSANIHKFLNADKTYVTDAPMTSANAVDMVQVNGYIVSIRATANMDGSPIKPLEVGGSESSHISLSAAFSSYSGGD